MFRWNFGTQPNGAFNVRLGDLVVDNSAVQKKTWRLFLLIKIASRVLKYPLEFLLQSYGTCKVWSITSRCFKNSGNFFCLAYVSWISPVKGDNRNVLRGVICLPLTSDQIVIFPGHLGKYHLFRLILLCNASTWTQASFIGKLAQLCLIALFLELHRLDSIVNKVVTTLFAMDQSLQRSVALKCT